MKGQYFFYLGLFLLPSAFLFSGIALFIALLISLYKNRSLFFKDKWNLPFILSSLLLFFSCLYNQIFINNPEVDYWIGLLNWLPSFIAFFSFQFYLDDPRKRYISSLLLLSGSFPVFYSCISQYFFQSYGPYQTLNGLIIWFQKPLNDPQLKDHFFKGVSGLFSNANYTGIWLAMIFPFALINCFKKKTGLIRKYFFWLLIFLITYLIILTESRNAFLGMIISIPIIFNLKGIIFLFLLALIFIMFISLNSFSLLPNTINELITKIMSDELILKFKLIFTDNIRIEIWKQTILKIINKPILGWGAGSFSIVFGSGFLKNNITQAHNLPLELAYNYGIPFSIILISVFSLLIIKASKVIFSFNKGFESFVDKAWLSSAVILLLGQLFDVTYYDGRINLSIWIFLAGLKTIIDKNQLSKKSSKIYS